jgi:periplasmic protein CpxP/Spy
MLMKPRLMKRVAPALLTATLAFPAAIALQTTAASAAESGAPAPGAVAESRKPAASAPAAGPIMARVEERITTLHAQLQITAAEEPLWQQFTQVMRENAENMEQNAADRATKFGALNAVENMKSYAKIAIEHGQNVQRLVTAFESVYNAMSPEQKKKADAVFRNRAEQQRQRHRR